MLVSLVMIRLPSVYDCPWQSLGETKSRKVSLAVTVTSTIESQPVLLVYLKLLLLPAGIDTPSKTKLVPLQAFARTWRSVVSLT